MNDTEMNQILELLREQQRLPRLDEMAWRQELPALDFRVVMARIVEAAKHGRIMVDHATGDSGHSDRYADADRAWHQLDSGNVTEAIAAAAETPPADRSVGQRALLQVAEIVRRAPAKDAKWAFRRVFNQLAADARRATAGELGPAKGPAALPVDGRRTS